MKTQILLPRNFRSIGWLLLLLGMIGIVLMVVQPGDYLSGTVFAIVEDGVFSPTQYLTWIENPLLDECIVLVMVVGGLFVGFARRDQEDEFLAQIRYESLVWGLLVNCVILILATIFVYGTYYMNMVFLNLFSMLAIFVVRLELKIYQLQKSLSDEE